jgi:hypothetical protein
MALEFELRTQKESPDKIDTAAKCLKRIKLLLQEEREQGKASRTKLVLTSTAQS